MKSKWVLRAALVAVTFPLVQGLSLGETPGQSQRGPSSGDSPSVKRGPIRSSIGETFQIAPSLDSAGRLNLIVSDGGERVISGQVTPQQLVVFRAIMREAAAFAFTEEAAGVTEPITTRFSTEHESTFQVDVMKFEDRSHFFINVGTQTGRITLNGGTVRRSDKKETGFFFDILAQLDLLLPPPARTEQPSNTRFP